MMLDRSKAPEFNKIKGFEVKKPVEKTLKNGIRVIIFHDESQDLCRIDWVFENQYHSKSQMIDHSAMVNTLLEGTSQRNQSELVEEVDFYGAYLIPEYSIDFTDIKLYSLHKHVDKLFPLVKEVLTESIFPEKEVATYIRNAKQKLEISLNKNDFLARRNFHKHVFGNAIYGQVAELEDYDSVTREKLSEIYHSTFYPQNCTLILAGNIDDFVLREIEKNFDGAWGNANNLDLIEKKEALYPSDDYLASDDDLHFHYQEKLDSLQSALRIGYQGIHRNHPDFPGFQLLNTLLGGYFGSRLMKNIREDKGFTYGINSMVASYKNTGIFSIATEVGVDVTQATLNEIEKEINLLKSEKVQEEELELVKNYMMGSLLGSLENIFSHADRYKTVLFSGLDLGYYEYYQKTLLALTPEEILNLANKYLDYSKMQKIVVGLIK